MEEWSNMRIEKEIKAISKDGFNLLGGPPLDNLGYALHKIAIFHPKPCNTFIYKT
jgi:hypothetical protein